MSVLSDKKIKARLEKPTGLQIYINNDPIAEERVEECSVNLTLSNEFMRVRAPNRFRVLDLLYTSKEDFENKWCQTVTTNASRGFFLRPNELVLARTEERLVIPPDILVQVTGRSTYARLGLEVHLTQDFKMPQDDSVVIFQIKNNSDFPIRLYPGMRILQVFFHEIPGGCQMTYADKPGANYRQQHQIGGSKFYQSPEYDDIRKEGAKLKQPNIDWDQALSLMLILAGVGSLFAGYENLISKQFRIGTAYATGAAIMIILIRFFRTFINRQT